MGTTEISVEREIEQVQDGTHYKGAVIIAGTSFDFEVVFSIPISDWEGNKTQLPKDKEAFRRVFQISVKRNGLEIALTDDEYQIFFDLLVLFSAGFYFLPQTRAWNETGLEALFVLDEDFEASATLGGSDSIRCVLEPAHVEMLNAPKFGCSIPAPA